MSVDLKKLIRARLADKKAEIYTDEDLDSFIEIAGLRLQCLGSALEPKEYPGVIIQGAVCFALASKAIAEKGREFTITEKNGISTIFPNISEVLMNQWEIENETFNEMLRRG